ncbi:MAG: lysophospholipid acyltransferase family protein [Bacteroidota bacterium]
MKKILAYILSVIYYIVFSIILLLFHPIQVIAYNLFGYSAHKRVVVVLNFLLVYNHYTLFNRPSFYGLEYIPKNRPLIIVGNHQSMYDISPAYVAFRKNHVKFISKIELAKKIPSISYNLRKGGSALIDRKDRQQSVNEISKLGKLIEEKKYSACIYPEGTRSRTGIVKDFRIGGFKTLLKEAPSALIVPFVIDGNYKLHKYGKFPLNIGLNLKYTALEPIEREGFTGEELLALVENKIKEALGQE